MKKWEYKTFDRAVYEKELNQLGEAGWELLIHTVAVSNGVFGANGQAQYYVFKREKNGQLRS